MPEWIEDGVLVTPRDDRILPIAARGKRMPELIRGSRLVVVKGGCCH